MSINQVIFNFADAAADPRLKVPNATNFVVAPTAHYFLEALRADFLGGAPRIAVLDEYNQLHVKREFSGKGLFRAASKFLDATTRFADAKTYCGETPPVPLPYNKAAAKDAETPWVLSFEYEPPNPKYETEEGRALIQQILWSETTLPPDFQPFPQIVVPEGRGSADFLFKAAAYDFAPWVSLQKLTTFPDSPIKLGLGFGEYGESFMQNLILHPSGKVATHYERAASEVAKNLGMHLGLMSGQSTEESSAAQLMEVSAKIFEHLKQHGFSEFALRLIRRQPGQISTQTQWQTETNELEWMHDYIADADRHSAAWAPTFEFRASRGRDLVVLFDFAGSMGQGDDRATFRLRYVDNTLADRPRPWDTEFMSMSSRYQVLPAHW